MNHGWHVKKAMFIQSKIDVTSIVFAKVKWDTKVIKPFQQREKLISSL